MVIKCLLIFLLFNTIIRVFYFILQCLYRNPLRYLCKGGSLSWEEFTGVNILRTYEYVFDNQLLLVCICVFNCVTSLHNV